MDPFVLFIAFALLAGGLAWWQHQQKLKRRTELNQLALQQGLAYSVHDLHGLGRMPFGFLRRGDDQGVENVLHGELDGRPVRLFDFWVMHESTDSKGNRSRRYERYTCAAAQVTDAWWPSLTVQPENVLSRLGDGLGMRDLQFESDDFNRTWNVTARDRRFAYAFLDARMMQWLLMAGTAYRFEVSGPYLMVVTDQLAPASWLTLHRVLGQFTDRIPAVARELYPLGD